MNDTYRCQLGGAAATITVGAVAMNVDGRHLAYVDIDAVEVDGHGVSLGVHGGDDVQLGGFGPRFDAFLTDLDAARGSTRRAALLQWTGTPQLDEYRQTPAGPQDVPTTVHLFADGLTVEPRNGVPDLVPFGLLEAVERDGHAVRLVRRGGLAPVTVCRLGARTDELIEDVSTARAALAGRVAAAFADLDDRLAGCNAPNGWAVPSSDAGVFAGALEDTFAAGARGDQLRVLAASTGGHLRYGLAMQPERPMPFVLAAGGSSTAVEAVGSEESRATYVFATTDVDALNVALVLTSFRREALYLPERELGRWSLAVRTLPVVQWARSVLVARVAHDDGWEAGVLAALG